MRITIQTILHHNQRYDTVGDWQFDEQGNLTIFVSETGDPRMNFLIARHELDEAMLCKFHGVDQKRVDEYDTTHEDAGNDCLSDNPDSPYYQEHCDALAAEWIMSRLLGVDWIAYDKAIESLTHV